jgi:hypothetical protein
MSWKGIPVQAALLLFAQGGPRVRDALLEWESGFHLTENANEDSRRS